MRAGTAAFGVEQGADRFVVTRRGQLRVTGHKNVETFMSYYRSGDVLASEAARLLE
ncbi:MAG: hypothetical protein WA159_01985 [Variovorax sp.]